MLDILFVSSPITYTDEPLAAVSVLGAVLVEHGLTYGYLDINAEVNRDAELLEPLISFCKDDYAVRGSDLIADHISETAKRILSKNARWIGMSLFCYQNQNYARLLCVELKLQNPNCSIVMGGPGIITNGLNGDNNIAEELLSLGLIDHYIRGDAEINLLHFLKGSDNTTYDSINDLPFADYDQYDMSLYPSKVLTIVGSRGCVRTCSFCDIHTHWFRYNARSGDMIYSEMVSLSEKYGVNEFLFADSLVNGNMIQFRKMIRLLSQHNNEAKSKMSWSGQFIFRPKNQTNDEDWQLIKQSGVKELYVGVESMIEHIRFHMGKKLTDEDIIYSLDQCLKHDIKCIMMMIPGYVTESSDDHRRQLEIYKQLTTYKKILKVSVGTPLGILPGTPLNDNLEELGIIKGSNENDWISVHSDLDERKRRRQETISLLKEIGLNQDRLEWMI